MTALLKYHKFRAHPFRLHPRVTFYPAEKVTKNAAGKQQNMIAASTRTEPRRGKELV